jgi:hypothetical protein
MLFTAMITQNETDNINNVKDLIFPRNSEPCGKSWEDWTIEWWKWLLSFPKDINPAFDLDGKIFHITPNDREIWFLVGTIGGVAERYYKVDSQKPVLFPIFNYIVSFADEPKAKEDKDLVNIVARDIDNIPTPFVSINGQSLNSLLQYRVSTEVFDLDLPESNLVTNEACSTKAASDGYWLILKPLAPGKYDIRCNGSCSSGKTSIDIIWHVTAF